MLKEITEFSLSVENILKLLFYKEMFKKYTNHKMCVAEIGGEVRGHQASNKNISLPGSCNMCGIC